MKQERELKFNLLCWAQYPTYENKQKRLNPKRESFFLPRFLREKKTKPIKTASTTYEWSSKSVISVH